MSLFDLVQQRQNINCDIIECLHAKITSIKVSAEDMIECATNIKGQGYSAFIRSREHFLEQIDEFKHQLELSSDINRCTHH